MTQTNHDSTITETLDTIIPYARKITVGSVVGYCSGIAAKTIGKMIAVTLGLGFIAIQSAVYVGYVQVDWNKIQKHAVAHVDVVRECRKPLIIPIDMKGMALCMYTYQHYTLYKKYTSE